MNNEFTLSVSERLSHFIVTIHFAEPFRVDDKDAHFPARARMVHFMKMNRVKMEPSPGLAKRIDEKTFRMRINK